MASEVCRRREKGMKDKVRVFNKDLVEQLVIDANDHIFSSVSGPKFLERHLKKLETSASSTGFASKTHLQQKRNGSGSGKRPATTSPVSLKASKNMDSEALIGHTLQLQKWLNEKSVSNVQKKSDVEARNTKRLYQPVLRSEATFVREMEDKTVQRDIANLRKKEMLHHKWQQRVYEPIRKQIKKEMDSPMYDEFALRKRAIHKEYIEHVNKKGHVFLDTFAPDEYYPMGLHPSKPSVLTAHTGPLRDPLISQEHDRCEDDRIVFRCLTGASLNDRDIAKLRYPHLPLVPQGRQGTDSVKWVEMPLGNIESTVRQASRRRMTPLRNSSQIEYNWDLDYLNDYTPSPRATNNIFSTEVPESNRAEKQRDANMPVPCEG